MKLNPDCVRDVMIALEDMTGVEFDSSSGRLSFKGITFHSFYMDAGLKSQYTRPEVAYTVLQLSESGYIIADCKRGNLLNLEIGYILYLTPKGHDVVSGLRDETTWAGKLKPALKKLGDISLTVIEAVSKGATDATLDRIIPALFDKP